VFELAWFNIPKIGEKMKMYFIYRFCTFSSNFLKPLNDKSYPLLTREQSKDCSCTKKSKIVLVGMIGRPFNVGTDGNPFNVGTDGKSFNVGTDG